MWCFTSFGRFISHSRRQTVGSSTTNNVPIETHWDKIFAYRVICLSNCVKCHWLKPCSGVLPHYMNISLVSFFFSIGCCHVGFGIFKLYLISVYFQSTFIRFAIWCHIVRASEEDGAVGTTIQNLYLRLHGLWIWSISLINISLLLSCYFIRFSFSASLHFFFNDPFFCRHFLVSFFFFYKQCC